jgi:phosphate transport system substrate-binding protein
MAAGRIISLMTIIALAAVSIVAAIWLWRNGGAGLSPHAASAQPSVEACDASVAGSSALTQRVAQQVAESFLRHGGYEVSVRPARENTGTVVSGVREGIRCSITIHPGTSTQAIRELASNSGAFVALSQRPLTDNDINLLRDAGAGDFSRDRLLAEHVVGFDAYGVVVNAANDVRQIRYDYLREIVFARVTNWAELGGQDAPLSLYSVRDGSETEDYPNDLVHQANPAWIEATHRATILPNEAAAVAAIAADSNAFSLMSTALVARSPGVRALAISFGGPARAPTAENVLNETYPMARRLFAYVRPDAMRNNNFVRSFVGFFATPDVFGVMEENGFAALRPTSRLSLAAEGLSGCRFGTPEYSALISTTRGARRLPVELRFDPNSMQPDTAALTYISANAPNLRQRLLLGDTAILIGHTDFTGDVARNRALALRRAIAVRIAFEARGVLGLGVESAGEVCPAADNQTEQGRELNRRVEIWVRSDARPAN